MEILAQLKKAGLEIGSLSITSQIGVSGKNKGKIIKNIYPPLNWKENTPFIKPSDNGFYFKTGKIQNVFMVDLDDMEDERCQKIKKFAEKCAGVVIKTRKGYHYYFTYDEAFPSNIQGDTYNVPIDIRSTGGMVICPPSTYYSPDKKEIFKYELLKCDGILPMSGQFKNYLVELLKPIPSNNDKKVTTSTNNEKQLPNISVNDEEQLYEDKILFRLICGLTPNRSKDGDSWRKAGYCFKNSDIDIQYFDLFSKLYYKLYDKEEVIHTYKNLKTRNESDTKLSVRTLWMWLKEDNEELFKLLCYEQIKDKIHIEIGEHEIFKYIKLIEYFEEDKKVLKEFFYHSFVHSKSYKYFNHFHVYNVPQATVYTISEEAPIAYKPNAIPNMVLVDPFTRCKHNFINLWERTKNIRLIEKFIFNPDNAYKDDPQYFNLFNGFRFGVDEEFNES